MKLATFDDGSRDGQLAVVSRDLSQAHFASGIATRLQQVLDDWNYLSPLLEDLSATLNHGKARHAFAFDPRLCLAPLPRACQWASALAFGPAETPDGAGDGTPACGVRAVAPQPRGSDGCFLGACREAWLDPAPAGFGCAAELVGVSGDIARGATPEAALEGLRLLMLTTVWAPCGPLPGEPAPRAPTVAFAPVAATPDELGAAWRGGRIDAELAFSVGGRPTLRCPALDARQPHLGQHTAWLARSHRLGAGSIIGAGPLVPDLAGADSRAHAGEVPALTRQALRPAPGERLRVELLGPDGQSVFGAVEPMWRELEAAP